MSGIDMWISGIDVWMSGIDVWMSGINVWCCFFLMYVCVVEVDCRDKRLGILLPDTSDKILGNAVHLKIGMVCDVIRLYIDTVFGGGD